MIAKLIFAGAAAAALSTVGGAFATTYSFTTIDVPDATFTVALRDQRFRRGYGLTRGPVPACSASSIQPEPIQRLDFPGSSDTVGLQINNSGVVVGNFNTVAFFYSGGTGGTYTEIDYPKSAMTVASGVNASGVVCRLLHVRSQSAGFRLCLLQWKLHSNKVPKIERHLRRGYRYVRRSGRLLHRGIPRIRLCGLGAERTRE